MECYEQTPLVKNFVKNSYDQQENQGESVRKNKII